MQQSVNLALQVLPTGLPREQAYGIVDEAIRVISASGLRYEVCPFETVIEGPYDQVMALVDEVQQACFAAGAEDMLVYIKLQRSKERSVSIDDKIEKYR